MQEKVRETLLGVRMQKKLVDQLQERQAQERRMTLRAISMDGMPRGSRSTAGLDAGMIRREEMERILRREEAALRRMERKARRAMEGMKPEIYAFCVMYYIAGMELRDAAEAVDRSLRQCRRYRKEIERSAT